MFSIFNNKPIQKVGFKDLLFSVKKTENCVVINTLNETEQLFLIKGTLPCNLEEKTINKLINDRKFSNTTFIIYGKNSIDNTIEKKYKQLKSMGFTKVYIYYGGLFEWILLQEAYGSDLFETTTLQSFEMGVCKYKPDKVI